MRRLMYALLVVAILGLIACAKPPQQDIDAAKKALNDARQAEAELYAPDAYKVAKDKEAQLDQELATQEKKFFKSYKLAKQYCDELKSLAEKAKAAAIEGKEKAKNEAQELITAAENAINTAKEDLKKAPKGKGTQADLAAYQGDIDAATNALNEAKTLFGQEKYLDAKAKAETAKSQAENVSNAIQQAIEAKKGGKK